MGMHDRDWYREEYARKNGMGYRSGNATYYALKRAAIRRTVKAASSWHWSLQLVLFLLICGVVLGALRLLQFIA